MNRVASSMCCSLFLRALAVSLAILAAARAARAETPATVVIVDGSGSMWGGLGNERASKFDLTRAALRSALTANAPQSRVGLLSFGHRRRADCSDVEMIVDPHTGAAEPFLTAVDRLNPKGKGPLALALREAAKSFPPGEAGSVLLIHDGVDNCQQDPCTAVAEIAQSNPRVAVNVISLALERPDLQRMACVSSLTRGKTYDVRDSASLNAAVVDALRHAGLESPTAQSPSPDAGSEQPASSGPPGLKLSATLAENGRVIARPIAWRIAKSEAPGVAVIERQAPQLDADLPPGSYVATASLDAVRAEAPVEVADKGRTTLNLALNAGTVNFSTRTASVTNPVTNPLLSISPPTDASRVREPIWIGRDPNAQVVVPAGQYVVRMEDGLISREATLTVAPGTAFDAPIVLTSGHVELSAVALAGGQPLDTVTYAISEDDPETPGGRREIARSAAPRASFVLPAGTYYVVATTGAAEARERLAIGAGDDLKHTVVMNVGRAIVSAQLDGSAAPAGEMITYRVARTEDTPREVARSSRTTPDFLLSAGRYRFEAQLAGHNVRAAADVDIAAGKEYRIALKLESAQVTIVPGTRASPSGNIRWEVKDSQGHAVLRSGIGGARTTRLSPGRYVLNSDSPGGTPERSFDLKAGEQRTIDLSLE